MPILWIGVRPQSYNMKQQSAQLLVASVLFSTCMFHSHSKALPTLAPCLKTIISYFVLLKLAEKKILIEESKRSSILSL